jgi:glycosyltransferase involved in cell wall biosynthesis
LRQSYNDFELILVDDGSTDRSGKICDELAGSDSRIVVIHCQNGGVVKAREKGLENSRGDYISFVDADDYISEDFLEKLYNDIVREDAEIACCKTMMLDGIQKRLIDSFDSYEVVQNKERFVKDFLEGENMYNKAVWAKVFKKSAIADIRLTKIRFGEDTVFMYEAFRKNLKVVLDPFVGYYYYRNSDSATLSDYSDEKEALIAMDHLYALEALSLLAKDLSPEYSRRANQKYASGIFAAVSRLIKCGNEALYKEKYHYISSNIKKLRGLEGISFKNRSVLTLYNAFPGMFRRAFRLLVAK